MANIGGDGRYAVTSKAYSPAYIDVNRGRVTRIINQPAYWSRYYLGMRLRQFKRAIRRHGCDVSPTRKVKA